MANKHRPPTRANERTRLESHLTPLDALLAPSALCAARWRQGQPIHTRLRLEPRPGLHAPTPTHPTSTPFHPPRPEIAPTPRAANAAPSVRRDGTATPAPPSAETARTRQLVSHGLERAVSGTAPSTDTVVSLVVPDHSPWLLRSVAASCAHDAVTTRHAHMEQLRDAAASPRVGPILGASHACQQGAAIERCE